MYGVYTHAMRKSEEEGVCVKGCCMCVYVEEVWIGVSTEEVKVKHGWMDGG